MYDTEQKHTRKDKEDAYPVFFGTAIAQAEPPSRRAEQLCRLLLLSLDRLAFNEMTLSHELIADMLGVRREGVNEAAGKLRAAGLIDYGRGHITAFDRQKLEAWVCECYQAVKSEYERVLPEVPSPSSWNPSKLSRVTARNSPSSGLRAFEQVAQG